MFLILLARAGMLRTYVCGLCVYLHSEGQVAKDQTVYGLSDEFKLRVKCGSCYLHCSLWGLGQNGGKDSLVEAVHSVEEKTSLIGFETHDKWTNNI